MVVRVLTGWAINIEKRVIGTNEKRYSARWIALKREFASVLGRLSFNYSCRGRVLEAIFGAAFCLERSSCALQEDEGSKDFDAGFHVFAKPVENGCSLKPLVPGLHSQ